MMNTKGVVGLKIARNKRMIDEELLEYDRIKLELLKKYGKEENNQVFITRDMEGFAKYEEEIKPYQEQELDFNFRIITDEDLEKSDLTAQQMMFLIDNFGG